MVECNLAKVDVAGSSPVVRSKNAQVSGPQPGRCLASGPVYRAYIARTPGRRLEHRTNLLGDLAVALDRRVLVDERSARCRVSDTRHELLRRGSGLRGDGDAVVA